MASIEIPNSPTNLTMIDFRSISDKYGSLQKSCKFVVQIVPGNNFLLPYSTFARDLMYLCEVAEFPGRSFMNMDVRYYGPNHKLPYQSQYEDINLTFLVRNNSLERQFFDDWMLIVNPVNTWDFNYRDDYTSSIHIYQFDEYGPTGRVAQPVPNPDGPPTSYTQSLDTAPKAQYWMTLWDAYPILINPQPVTWADDQFQRVIISLTYTRWTRQGIDPRPRGAGTDAFSYDLVQGAQNTR